LSARRAFNHGLEGIDALYERAVKWEVRQHQKIEVQLVKLGLKQSEAEAWVAHEPNFAKRIVTPLDGNHHQTGRYQNPTSQGLNERLNACDQNRDQELL